MHTLLHLELNLINKMETTIIRTCHDENCPKCNFPETIIIRIADSMRPIWEECGNIGCDWGRKIFTKRKSIKLKKKNDKKI